MQQETTHGGLLGSTSHEPLLSGYQKASLRTIHRNIGVTTGALYFFFKDRSASFHVLIEDVAEAVMQMLHQHTSLEEEVHNNADQLMDMEHDTRFAQELIFFYYAHEAVLELLLNCFQGSTYQDFTEQVIACLVKRSMKITSAVVKDDDTVFSMCTLHWLSRIRVEAFLHILSHHCSQEQALHWIHTVVTFSRGGFEGLYQQTTKNQIRGIFPFSFTV